MADHAADDCPSTYVGPGLPAPAATPEIAPKPEQDAEPKVDEIKLAALTDAKPEPAQPKPVDKASEEKKKADLSKANEKLSGLLGGDNKD